MKLSEMQYVRPDIGEITLKAQALTKALKEADTFEKADGAFAGMDKLQSGLETMSTLAYIRHSVNTLDEFYDGEQSFIDDNLPVVEEYFQSFTLALLSSPFRGELEKKYGELIFKNAEIELKTFSPEIIADLQEESRLVTEYEKLLASAQIDFEGELRTIPQLSPFKQSTDDALRLAAWTAEGSFYMSHKEELDSFYDRLTKLRDSMGKKLGFGGFTPLGYARMMRNSYTPEDVSSFREAVVKYLVPLADRIYRAQAERTGKSYPLTYSDAALDFADGNANPQGTAEDILAHARTLYHELSPETGEFIDFMLDNELMDVLSKKGKANGGYCTSIPDYNSQFIFANFNGTSSDVETVTHEAGHAFAGCVAGDSLPLALRSPTLESCEIHSMTMEFFAWDWAEGFYGKDTDKFRYQHLAGALKFIPYGTMVDHFQHIVYEHPELTPAERDGEWKRLTGIYMPWIKLGEIPFYGDGCAWQRQHHIYSNPFYYIDYCLAQTVALEFWAIMRTDRDKAWKAYMSLVSQAGTKTFDGLVEHAGLRSPFDPETLREVCETAAKWLDDNPPC